MFRLSKKSTSILSNTKRFMSTDNSHTLRVATYNILSSSLSAPSYFTMCSPDHLEPETRIKKCISRINDEVDKNAIVCLQEVSQTYLNNIHPYFASKNYHVIASNYGNKFNNYMGVTLAYPVDKYILLGVDVVKVGETKKYFKKYPKTPFDKLKSSIGKFFLKSLQQINLYSPPYDLWDEVTSKQNRLICVKLECKETSKQFVIGNYHMPCNFRRPSFMNAHCALTAQHIQRYANNLPYILCGDFNIKPGSSSHSLLLNGNIDKAHEDYPLPLPEDNWLPKFDPLISAYKSKNGAEPNFTNFAFSINDKEPFIDTLDYIFHSKDFETIDTLPLPHRNEVKGPLPNELEGSDHIMIAATLKSIENFTKSTKSNNTEGYISSESQIYTSFKPDDIASTIST